MAFGPHDDDSHLTEADEGPYFALSEDGDIVLREPCPRPRGLPSQGQPETHRRNERRRRSRQMTALKTAGILPQHANVNDLQAWRQQTGINTTANIRAEIRQGTPVTQRLQHDQASHATQQPTNTSDHTAHRANRYGLQRVEQPEEAKAEAALNDGKSLRAYDEAMRDEVKLARDSGRLQRGMAMLGVAESKKKSEE